MRNVCIMENRISAHESMKCGKRSCHLKKKKKSTNTSANNADAEEAEFGFNLKSQKQCHIVGRVDRHTPADEAGLRGGDRIIEINHKAVSSFDFAHIKDLVRQGYNGNTNEVLMLVASADVGEDRRADATTTKEQMPLRRSARPTIKRNDILFSNRCHIELPINIPTVRGGGGKTTLNSYSVNKRLTHEQVTYI